MKKVFMICALLFSVITFANAQGGGRPQGTPEERAKRMVDQLTEKLKLTDDQKTKVTALYVEQGAAQTKARETAGEDREAMRASMTKIQGETEKKVEALLTDDQKKAYTAYKEERKAAMQNRGGGPAGGGK